MSPQLKRMLKGSLIGALVVPIVGLPVAYATGLGTLNLDQTMELGWLEPGEGLAFLFAVIFSPLLVVAMLPAGLLVGGVIIARREELGTGRLSLLTAGAVVVVTLIFLGIWGFGERSFFTTVSMALAVIGSGTGGLVLGQILARWG